MAKRFRRRERLFTLLLTEDEWQSLTAETKRAKQSGALAKTKAAIVRQRIFGNNRQASDAPRLDEFIAKQIKGDISRWSANLNQLAHHANSGRFENFTRERVLEIHKDWLLIQNEVLPLLFE